MIKENQTHNSIVKQLPDGDFVIELPKQIIEDYNLNEDSIFDVKRQASSVVLKQV